MSQSNLMLASLPALAAMERVVISVLLLDRSGSMDHFGQKPREQVNRFLKELSQDENADQIMVGVMTFSDQMAIDVPLQNAQLCPQVPTYTASGGTALYHTAYETLGALMLLTNSRGNRGLKTDVLVNVFTDGEDTSSPQNLLPGLRALCLEGRNRGWQLRVFGFGVDAVAIAADMGFIDKIHPQANPNCGGYTVEATAAGMEHSTIFVVQATSRTTVMGGGPPKP